MRRIEQILRHPRTADEERIAAEHIRVERERIQAGWSAHERSKRQIVATERPLLREIQMRDVVGAGRVRIGPSPPFRVSPRSHSSKHVRDVSFVTERCLVDHLLRNGIGVRHRQAQSWIRHHPSDAPQHVERLLWVPEPDVPFGALL